MTNPVSENVCDVSVTEGDSVTLNTEISEHDTLEWTYEKALMSKFNRYVLVLNAEFEIFRDKLKLDNQTRSLTIINITTKDAGIYKLNNWTTGGERSLKAFRVSVYGE